MIDRIKKLIDKHSGGNVSAFANEISVRQNTLSQYLNAKRNVSLDVVVKIAAAIPNVSTEWLLTGEGEMFITPEKKGEKENSSFGLLEILEKFDVKEERLLAIIESQQRAIETLSMTTKKILVQAEESVTCADAAGSEFRK